jgi:hypothetical protein
MADHVGLGGCDHAFSRLARDARDAERPAAGLRRPRIPPSDTGANATGRNAEITPPTRVMGYQVGKCRRRGRTTSSRRLIIPMISELTRTLRAAATGTAHGRWRRSSRERCGRAVGQDGGEVSDRDAVADAAQVGIQRGRPGNICPYASSLPTQYPNMRAVPGTVSRCPIVTHAKASANSTDANGAAACPARLPCDSRPEPSGTTRQAHRPRRARRPRCRTAGEARC